MISQNRPKMMPPVDMSKVASAFKQKENNLRYRFGTVVSVENDHTCTVTIGGDGTPISGIRYMDVPRPGAVVIMATDGLDIFVKGHLSSGSGTLAPRASRSTSQSITTATDTSIQFDGVNNDPWGCWSALNPGLLTAPVTGRYMVTACVDWAASSAGYRKVWIEKDGTSTVGQVDAIAASSASDMWVNVSTPAFDMAQGSYVRLMVRQNSGGALNALNSSTFAPSMSLIYLGP